MFPGKMVFGKNGPRKIGPRKNILQKLFSVKGVLINSNDLFVSIDWLRYTHKKMFDVHLMILHAPNCRTLKESRNLCCRVLGFHRSVTSENSTYTPRYSTLTLRFFVSAFSGTIFPGTIFPRDHFSRYHFSRYHFSGDRFSRGPIFRGPFIRNSFHHKKLGTFIYTILSDCYHLRKTSFF